MFLNSMRHVINLVQHLELTFSEFTLIHSSYVLFSCLKKCNVMPNTRKYYWMWEGSVKKIITSFDVIPFWVPRIFIAIWMDWRSFGKWLYMEQSQWNDIITDIPDSTGLYLEIDLNLHSNCQCHWLQLIFKRHFRVLHLLQTTLHGSLLYEDEKNLILWCRDIILHLVIYQLLKYCNYSAQ